MSGAFLTVSDTPPGFTGSAVVAPLTSLGALLTNAINITVTFLRIKGSTPGVLLTRSSRFQASGRRLPA